MYVSISCGRLQKRKGPFVDLGPKSKRGKRDRFGKRKAQIINAREFCCPQKRGRDADMGLQKKESLPKRVPSPSKVRRKAKNRGAT